MGDLSVPYSCCAHGASKVGSGPVGSDFDFLQEVWMRAAHCFPEGSIPQDKVTDRAHLLRDELPFFVADEQLDLGGTDQFMERDVGE